MTDERLIEILAAYGATSRNWPVDERFEAEALLNDHPDRFADALTEAQLMDTQLGALPAVDLPNGLIESILEAAPIEESRSQTVPFGFSRKRIQLWASGFATACLALGLALGYSIPAENGFDYDPSEAVLTYALFDADYSSFIDEAGG